MREFIAADYVFKSFCENNLDGQAMLVSTLTPQPLSIIHAPLEEDVHVSFGRMLLRGLTLSESDGDLETCCRAASVLSHILNDNIHCKERILQVKLEAPEQSLGGPEPLMHHLVKYLALASNTKSKDGKTGLSNRTYIPTILLKLLVIWLSNCPNAVSCFLDSRPHLTYLLELISTPTPTPSVKGLTALLLGECVIYNKISDKGRDGYSVVDTISQKIGLTSYFSKFDEMQKGLLFLSEIPALSRKPMTRSTAASMSEIEDVEENESTDQKNEDRWILEMVFDSTFVMFVNGLEGNVREQIVEIFSRPKSQVAVVPAELEQKSGESDGEYIQRLKRFVENQCVEIQDLLSRNSTLAEDLANTGGKGSSSNHVHDSSDRIQLESLRRELNETSKRLETLKAEKSRIESEASTHQNSAIKMESDLKSLSGAYNSLEQANFQLEREVKALRSGAPVPIPDLDAIREEAREEAQRECEAELNDLLVCLGQEQSKVEKLSARLVELGEDVEKLLEGIGDDTGIQEEDNEEEED